MSLYEDVPLLWALFWVLSDFWVSFWIVPGFLGIFLDCSRIFGYLFGLFPDFWVSFWIVPGFLGIISFGEIFFV